MLQRRAGRAGRARRLEVKVAGRMLLEALVKKKSNEYFHLVVRSMEVAFVFFFIILKIVIFRLVILVFFFHFQSKKRIPSLV